MNSGTDRAQVSRPIPDAAAFSRLRASRFSRSLQRRLQVHRQQARPHPDLLRLFPIIPDPREAEVLFAVPDRAFDPVPLFLLPLEPAVRPRRFHPSPQRFERRPHAQRFQSRSVSPHPVFRVGHEVRWKLPEPVPIRREVPAHMLRLVERFVLPVVQEQEPAILLSIAYSKSSAFSAETS